MQGGEGPGSGGEEGRGPLTASFEGVPGAHDGAEFAFLVRLSETVGKFSRSPRASSFAVTGGRVTGVEQVGAGLWRVTVRPVRSPGPESSGDVTVTLAGGRDCDDEPSGAVCARDGRSLSNTSAATVRGPALQPEPEAPRTVTVASGNVPPGGSSGGGGPSGDGAAAVSVTAGTAAPGARAPSVRRTASCPGPPN